MEQNKRKITKQQELAYRLVSGDFEGLDVGQAAIQMGIVPSAVYRLLKRMETLAPQLFPLITRREKLVLGLLKDGRRTADIGKTLGITCTAARQLTNSLVKKGRWSKIPVKTLSFDGSMETQIKEVF